MNERLPVKKDLGYTEHTFHGPNNHFFPKYQHIGVPSAPDQDPYCFAADENWDELARKWGVGDPDLEEHLTIGPRVSACLADPNKPPFYTQSFHSPVLLKRNLGLETGLILSPEDTWFITSGVYLQEKDKPFVLLARPAHIVAETKELLKEKLLEVNQKHQNEISLLTKLRRIFS